MPDADAPLLKVENIHKCFGSQDVLNGICVDASRGDVITILRARIGKKGMMVDISMDGLKGKTIGAQRATISSDSLESDAAKSFEFKGDRVFENDLIGIAVRKGQDELRMNLNKAIKDIVANGTYKSISRKYYGDADIY
ncbi:MAG: transporter substrate-binding domain-containing protein [Magnetovibrio sp.]|nr:transporter substrate-binding domain-containing protein [Magnetovibrio sp.]